MNEAEGVICDQQYVVDVATGKSRRVSSGKGRTTCGYFYDGDRASSTPPPTSPVPRARRPSTTRRATSGR